MEIIKQLNLNGNPQTVPNGSLVFAKNIKLSADGTFITNDDGVKTAFDDYDDSEELRHKLKVENIKGEKVNKLFDFISDYDRIINNVNITIERQRNDLKIVGYINCPNEIVFLTYNTYKDYNKDTREIIEEGEESIIYRAVEYKDDAINYDNENVFALFKVPTGWVYDGGNIVGTYTYNVYGHLIIGIAESNAKIDKQLLTIDLNDSDYGDALDKYSCAPNIPIANLTLNGKVKGSAMARGLYYFFIRYEVSDKLYTNWFPIGAPQYALSLDYKTMVDHVYGIVENLDVTKYTSSSLLVNTDKESYYNFDFTISFNNIYSYIGYQIAYILQTDDTSVGRIWNGFEFSANELTKSFLFNGGYIEEVDIADLTRDVLNIYNAKALTVYNNKLYAANFKETDYNINLQDYANEIDTYLIKKVVDTQVIEKASTLMVKWTYRIQGGEVGIFEINAPADISSVNLKDVYSTNIPDKSMLDWLGDVMSWNVKEEYQDIRLMIGTDPKLILTTKGLVISPSEDCWGNNPAKSFRDDVSPDVYAFGRWLKFGDWQGYGDIEKRYITISKDVSENSYNTYSTDNIIRTLMPYEVYAFYVHYVRPDGSYTNGIPLENKVPIDSNSLLYKKIGDIDASRLPSELSDIATIPEIKDKYLYELFIRSKAFSKQYFGIYLDNKGKRLFRTDSGILHKVGQGEDKTYILRLGVRFENISYPPGYIGAFFSYEKINALSVYQGYVSEQINSGVLLKANDVESANSRYDGTLFVPHHKIVDGEIGSIASEPYYAYINNSAPVLSNAAITFEGEVLSRLGLHGGIAMNMSKKLNGDVAEPYNPAEGIIGSIILFNRSIYSNEVKELIPFGPITTTNFYGEEDENSRESIPPSEEDTIINYDINYPSFLLQDKIFKYKSPIFINETCSVNVVEPKGGVNVINPQKYYQDNQYIDSFYVWKFSNLNLLALSIKKEPEVVSGIMTGVQGEEELDHSVNSINTIVRPVNASDLFKLESCYIPKIHKAYTNYNKNLVTPNILTNLIRCSYPIRNESGINSWRLFNPLNYYPIDNSNGEIVHIFAAGSSFYIHTRNNLLVTSSNAKLKADNETIHIQQNNVFDVEPHEIFTSDLGYGGIKYQKCQLFSQLGYIWYDSDRHKLFRFDNGNLVDITSGIDEIVKKYNFEYCFINIDNKSNRVFFCFYDYNKNNPLTLGYDILSNKWLSIYDFEYDMSIHTANRILFGESDQYYIYLYSKSAAPCNYSTLKSEFGDFPSYIPVGSHSNASYFCFDVIFNEAYTIPKVLDSISWIHECIELHTTDFNHPAQLKLEVENVLNRTQDLNGVSIIVYSDSVDSGRLELQHDVLNDVANKNNPNAYKYPYYNKGIWNLNYFRNNIIEPVTDSELEMLSEQYGIDAESLKKVYKVTDRHGSPVYRVSDLRSLIYGKYIAVRFIFYTTNRIKFDNLVFNIQKY